MPRLVRSVTQPWSASRVGDELLAAFEGPFTTMCAAIGFVNGSGVRYIAQPLADFRDRGGTARFLVGLDGAVTTAPGVRALSRLVDELWVFRNPGRPLFHPKTYLFESDDEGLAVIGSANLTESALWVNYEDMAVLAFDLTDADDRRDFDALKRSFTDAIASPNAHQADDDLLDRLEGTGVLPSEARRRRTTHRSETETDRHLADRGVGDLFPPAAPAPPPAVDPLPEEERDVAANPPSSPLGPSGPPPAAPPTGSPHRVFVLRLGRRDVGVQPGYSPDVFIPMAALNADPAFWNQNRFTPHTTSDGNSYDQRHALFEFHRRNGDVEIEERRLYYYPARHEFRFSSSQIHADSVEGDLMRIEIASPGLGIEYLAQVIKPTDALFALNDAIASNDVQNSQKRWGYA